MKINQVNHVALKHKLVHELTNNSQNCLPRTVKYIIDIYMDLGDYY